MSLKGAKGVDISYANGNADLRKIKDAGFRFVMIKCASGSDIESQDDSCFEENVRKAEALGLPWGAYLYSYATSVEEAKSEVEHVKRLLKNKKPTLPVAFDMEDADGYKARHGAMKAVLITQICETFLEGIKNAGYYPILYTSLSWIGGYISTKVTDKYDLWVAQWSSKCDYKGKNLGMWQYGGETNFIDGNSIEGVGMIDKDKCFKDYPSIIKNGGFNNWEKPCREATVKRNCRLYLKCCKDPAGDSIASVPAQKGEKLILLKDRKNGWSKVEYKGKKYFAQNSFLKGGKLSRFRKKTLKLNHDAIAVEKNSLQGPSKIIKAGETVKIFCKITDGVFRGFFYVESEGKRFYMR